MSETDNNTQRQKPEMSKLAIASSTCIFLFIIFTVFASITSYLNDQIVKFFALLAVSSLVISLILGLIAKRKIKQSKGILTGKLFANIGITVAVFLIILTFIPALGRMGPYAYRVRCMASMHAIEVGLYDYTQENQGKYPDPNKWCDILKGRFVREEIFKDIFHFAMNPKCTPDSPANTVLLFETKSGWNQFGQAELIYLKKYDKKGCIILFNDGRVDFIEPNNIDKLNWGN